MSKNKELTDEQKRQFRQLFRIALNGHDHSCHYLCTYGDAAPYDHLRQALNNQPLEGEPVDPAIKTGIEMCRAKGIPLTAKNSAEENPVFFVSGRCFACYLYLVDQDLKPAHQNLWGVTTLNQSCQLLIETGDARILQHLITNKHYPVDLADDSDQTLMHQAAKNNSPYTIHFLLDMGADINFRDTNHRTPLWIACWKACFEAAQALIKRGAKYTGSHMADDKKETLLHVACRSSVASKKLIKMLIWKGIPLTHDGCTCKPTKKVFCKKITPHMRDYIHDKFVEYNAKKQPKPQSSSPSVLKRFLSRSNNLKVQKTASSPENVGGSAAARSSLAGNSLSPPSPNLTSRGATSRSSSSSSVVDISCATGGSSSAEKFKIICLGDTLQSLAERSRSSTMADLASEAN